MSGQNLPTLSIGNLTTRRPLSDDLNRYELFEGVLLRRVFAYAFDLLVMGFLVAAFWFAGLLTFGALWPLQGLFLLLLPFAYSSFLISNNGATLGMALFGLEVVTTEGERPSLLEAFVMSALFYAGAAVTGWLILIVVLFNERRRTMHDFFSNCVVLRKDVLRRSP